MTVRIAQVHHTAIPWEIRMFIAQTMVEYGILNAIAAGFSAAVNRVEVYIGSGNSKYALILVLVMIVLLLARRRR